MNAVLKAGLVMLALCGQSAVAADVKVVSDRDFHLLVVDATRAGTNRTALHDAFAASLSKALSKSCGSTVPVKTKDVKADAAAFELQNHSCDAVLVIGQSMPRPLMVSGVARLEATVLLSGKDKQVYLVFSNEDKSLVTYLTASFADALGDPRFMDVMDPDVVTEGSKVASR